jgi:hypothetical protein
MLHTWEDRKAVYMSPTIVGLCVVVFLLLVGWMNRDFVHGWFSHITPASKNELRGEWVGHLDIDGMLEPDQKDLKKRAVIRFNLKITDSFLEKYGGRGELTIEGEKPQSIEVRDLWPQSRPKDGTFDTGIWLDTYTPKSKNDLFSGGFKGVFKPGSLSLERDDQGGYAMKGVLQKGSDADYEALVKQMQQTVEK